MFERHGFPIVISGPSGVGKTTIARAVVGRLDGLVFSVSVTTRPPRAGERDGIDYFFRTREEFAAMRDAGELLEWTTYCGHNYGTPRAPLESQIAQGYDVLLDIDARGAAQVRGRLRGAVSVFVLPPDIVELERRIRNRGCASEDELATRLNQARIELAAARQYDYVVVNESVPGAVEALVSIIRAERCRTPRMERLLGLTREGEEAC